MVHNCQFVVINTHLLLALVSDIPKNNLEILHATKPHKQKHKIIFYKHKMLCIDFESLIPQESMST